MSSRETFKSIPIIDVSGLYAEDLESREAVASEIGDAARNVGFFVIKGHRISPDVINDLLSAAKDFFTQTEEYKRQYLIGSGGFHNGYVPIGEEKFSQSPDCKEAFQVNEDLDPNDPRVLKQRFPLFGPVNWPNIPEFRYRVNKYFKEAQDLGRHIWRGFVLSLGLDEDAFSEEVKRPPSFLRMNHYPPSGKIPNALGFSSHTDYEAFTILLSLEEGLQAMNESGEWINVPVIPGTFVVNIGDTLESLTAGQFVATTHRVRQVKEERYSFPLFFSCDHETEVKPLPQFDVEKAKYPATTFGDHLWASLVSTHSYLAKGVKEGRLPAPNPNSLQEFGYHK